jgi:hypothetical protein
LRPRAREPVQFTVVMTPEPPMTGFTWYRQSPNTEATFVSTGESIEVQFEPGLHSMMLTATWGAGEYERQHAEVRVDVCPLAGDSCRDRPVPCCTGLVCDAAADVCR